MINWRRQFTRPPITPDMLSKILQLWSHSPHNPDSIMLWAAFCLGYFGFMRSGEFTSPSIDEFKADLLSGTSLSKPRLIASLRRVLQEVGVDSSKYSGHSFRIGTATMAAKLGVSDLLINILGWWRSSAFVHYIRTPWEQLSLFSSLLSGDGVVDTAGRKP